MHTKSYKYPLLNDSAWLRHEYIDLLKSTRVIGNIVGSGPNSVRQALIRHKIPVRSVSAGLLCTNANISIDRCVVDGGLLGDASLRMYNPSNASSGAYYLHGIDMKCSGCQKEIDYKQTPPIAVGEGEFVHDSKCEENYYQNLNQQIKKSFAKVNSMQTKKCII